MVQHERKDECCKFVAAHVPVISDHRKSSSGSELLCLNALQDLAVFLKHTLEISRKKGVYPHNVGTSVFDSV